MREPPERPDRCVQTRRSTPQASTDIVVAHVASYFAIPIPIENTAKTSILCRGGGAAPATKPSSSPHSAEIPPLSRVRCPLHEDPELPTTLGLVREEADLVTLCRKVVPELRLSPRHVHPLVTQADDGIRRRRALGGC